MNASQDPAAPGGSSSSKPAKGAGRRPFLELQYHPADIRKGVRYLFLTRRQLVGWCAGALAYLIFVAFVLAITPSVLANLLAKKRYEDLEVRRTQQGERLEQLVAKLAELDERSDELRIEVSKIYLAYGFSGDGSRGKGGYPNPALQDPAQLPDSIYSATIRRGNGLRARIGEQVDVLTVFLDEVQTFESANDTQVRMTPSVSPLQSDDFVLTSPFGTRRSPFTKEIDFHAGVDLAAAVGTEVRAPADGVVTFAGRYPLQRSVSWWRYGNLVAIEHGDRFISLYGHLDEIKVQLGQKIAQGDLIATVGSTGWSTNPHLHYEIRRRNTEGQWYPVDPRIYMLDHRWRDEERLLVRARQAPSTDEYEPLPNVISR